MRFGTLLSLLFALTAISNTSFAQGNGFYVNGNGGHLMFFGDIRQYDIVPGDHDEEILNFGGGLEIGYEFNPFLDIHLSGLHGNLGGVRRNNFFELGDNDDDERIFRNDGIPSTRFESRFVDGAVNLRFYPLNLLFKKDDSKKKKFAPYIKAGVGATVYQSLTATLFDNVRINSVGFEDLDDEDWQEDLIIPVGAGVKFRLAPRLDIGLDHTLRFLPNSDAIDLTERGDRNDAYGYTNLGITYTFGKNKYAKHWSNNGDGLNKKIKEVDDKAEKNKKKAAANEEGLKANTEELEKIQALADEMGKDLDEILTLDTDGDGIPNYKDKSNNTPSGVEVDKDGVPIETDTDGDGIPDRLDKEANTPKGNTVNWEGVSIVTLEDARARENALKATTPKFDHKFIIFFDTDKSRVNTEAYDKLVQAAEILNKTGKTGYITGHADSRGAESYNKTLSVKRAERIAKVLTEQFHVDPSQLVIEGRGEEEPLSQDKRKNLKINRRVDIHIR